MGNQPCRSSQTPTAIFCVTAVGYSCTGCLELWHCALSALVTAVQQSFFSPRSSLWKASHFSLKEQSSAAGRAATGTSLPLQEGQVSENKETKSCCSLKEFLACSIWCQEKVECVSMMQEMTASHQRPLLSSANVTGIKHSKMPGHSFF